MGEFADMAVDEALNGGYWYGDFDDDEELWIGRPRRRFSRRLTHEEKVRFVSAPAATAEDFADL